MSMTASMHSWCHEFKNKCADRATAIRGVKKHSSHVLRSHKDSRVKMGLKTRKILQVERSRIKMKAFTIVKSYFKERVEARGMLSAMRGKKTLLN